jgi:hypothetical protein
MSPHYEDARSITERQLRAQNLERQEHNRRMLLLLLSRSYNSGYENHAWWKGLGLADRMGLRDDEYDVARHLVEKKCWNHDDWFHAARILNDHAGQLCRISLDFGIGKDLRFQPQLGLRVVPDVTVRLHAIHMRRAQAA